MSTKRPHLVAEILTIGREILDGRVIDTNRVFLALELKKIGIVPRYSQSVDDDEERIQEAFAIAASRSNIILVTGGLGPTSDDMTIEVFAKFLNRSLFTHEQAKATLLKRLEKMGRLPNESHLKQVMIPTGAEPLENKAGTAPGVYYHQADQHWFFLPGVPREMKLLFEESVKPKLPQGLDYHSVQFLSQFTLEADLNQKLMSFQKSLPKNIELSFQTRFPENLIGLHGEGEAFFVLLEELRKLIGPLCVAESQDRGDLLSLEELVLEKFKKQSARITTVESCTGGQVYQRLTAIPGASAVMWGAFGVYDNEAKLALGLSLETLKKHGAVSAEVAQELAVLGWKKTSGVSGSKTCVSTTGIAGPSGGTPEKPVGLCFFRIGSRRGFSN